MVVGCDFWRCFFFFLNFILFYFSLGGFCGGCFLQWLLLVVGLVVFLMGFGGSHGGGVVGLLGCEWRGGFVVAVSCGCWL